MKTLGQLRCVTPKCHVDGLALEVFKKPLGDWFKIKECCEDLFTDYCITVRISTLTVPEKELTFNIIQKTCRHDSKAFELVHKTIVLEIDQQLGAVVVLRGRNYPIDGQEKVSGVWLRLLILEPAGAKEFFYLLSPDRQ